MEKMYKIAQEPENRYCNYFDYAVQLRGEHTSLKIDGIYVPNGCIAHNIELSFQKGEIIYSMTDFQDVKVEYERIWNGADCKLKISLKNGPCDFTSAEIRIIVNRDGICITTDSEENGFIALFSGELLFGDTSCLQAVCFERMGQDIRSAYGPAASKIDDALFHRETDCALHIESKKSRIRYDFGKEAYCFTACTKLQIHVEEHVFANRFHIKYKGINKKNTFPTPPAGWMTWYAVKFDACETAVLENARKQQELFADYGANTIWVDWEWYHSAFNAEDDNPEIHYFSPDPVRYPHGLKFVSDKIRDLGFIPALWVGPTNETALTDYMKQNEYSVYADKVTWCGRYFYDITREEYLREFIPKAFRQVKEWGYEAVKWDCIPISLEYADIFHGYLTNPTLSSEQAFRQVVEIARGTLGNDFYMLSCAGEWDRAVLFASDMFDAARIGGDIFSWEEFKTNFLERVMRLYVYHNNTIYCDPDNLVIRPEYNSYDQAITRASLISLLGLPLTLGDDLRELESDRVEIIRRALPPLDIRTMDIRESHLCSDRLIVNLQIAKEFAEWNVVQVANLLTEEKSIVVDFDKDLHLESGNYLVYDYWKHQFLGEMDSNIVLSLPACGSCVLAIHLVKGQKQVVSTSRHISQGGFDLIKLWTDDNGALHGRSNMVKDEPYVITVYDPDIKDVFDYSVYPKYTGEADWVIL